MPSPLDQTIELIRQWTPESLVAFYNAVQKDADADTPIQFPDHLWPVALGLCDTRINKLMLQVGPGSGKAQHPDEPVLSDKGWIRIGDLKVGDVVRTPTGGAATVKAVQWTSSEPLQKVTFSDGRSTLVHPNHLWKVHHKKMREHTFGGHKVGRWRVKETFKIKEQLKNKPLYQYVPLCDEIEFSEQEFDIPPYLLGAILGDGHISTVGFATLTSYDDWIVKRVHREMHRTKYHGISFHSAARHYGLPGLGKEICALGLRDARSWEKFIPEQYKYGSIEQRYALIQGLFDTDGTVADAKKKSVSFTTTSERMAKDVQEIIWSLGGIATIGVKKPWFTYKGERREGRTAYNVSVRHPKPSMLFSLPRKVDLAVKTQYSDTLKLRIVSIEDDAISESVCISLDNEDGLYLTRDYLVTHNSLLLSQMYPAWVLGHDSKKTIMTISGAEDLASGFVSTVMHVIEHSKTFQQCFPNVRPDKNRGWSIGSGAFVTGSRIAQPDASYAGFGLASKALTGKHAGLIIIDDAHDDENSSTKEQCIKVTNRYSSQIVGRAESTGARFLLAGRRWSVHDLYGTLEKSGAWVVLRLPAERPDSELLYYDVYVPDDLQCVYTDGFCEMPDGEQVLCHSGKLPPRSPLARSNKMSKMKWVYGKDPMKQGFFWPSSKQKRLDYLEQKHMNPTITKAVYQCDPASVETAVFLPEDFEMTFTAPDDLDMGRNSPEVDAFCQNGMVVQAWDTAFSANSSSDSTVCVTALLIYNDKYRNDEDEEMLGPCEPHYIVRVLDVKRVKLTFSEVVREIRSEYMKWRPTTIVIENKAYAVAAIELLRNSGLPIEPVTPEASKRARAIEGLGAGSAQGWFRQKRVEFPDEAPEWFAKFKEEMLDFTGDPGRTDDQVDAIVHLIRWTIMEGTGAIMPTGWGSVAEVNKQMSAANAIGSPLGMHQFNPFDSTCGACMFYDMQSSYCKKHNIKTVSIGSCDSHRLSTDPTLRPISQDLAGFLWTMKA